MTKFQTIAWSASTACFGVATVASACGGATTSNNYDGNSDWKKTSNEHKVSVQKGGYDYQKHGDKNAEYASANHEDSSKKDGSWNKENKDSSWNKDDASHDNQWQQGDWQNASSNHDDGWTEDMNHSVAEWGNWSPDTWHEAGHSYDEWNGGFEGYMSGFQWNGGNDDWTPSYGAGWESDWNAWNPKAWKDAGSSYQNWHNQMKAHMQWCQDDWQSKDDAKKDDSKHEDNSWSEDETWNEDHASNKDDSNKYDDEWNDNSDESSWKDSGESHDYSKSDDSSWKGDAKQASYSSDNGNGYGSEDENCDHDTQSAWGGKIKDDSGKEVAYSVRD